MRDFQAIKEEIRQRVALVDIVSEQVTLTRSGRSFRGLCPFHKEKTPSFHVIPEKMIFHCFGCKAGGDVFKFIQLREGVSFGEAVRMLADRAGIELRARRAAGSTGPDRAELAKVNEWAARFYRRQLLDPIRGESARSYLAGRGVSNEIAERFGLGLATGGGSAIRQAAKLAGISEQLLLATGLVRRDDRGSTYDTFRDRLIFPIRDATKRVIGFGGRTLVEAPAKYLNTAQNELFDKGRTLYGVDLARADIAASGRAVIVEGYTDCIACHQYGFGSAVATLGTAMTEAHIGLLRRYGDKMLLVFDSDEAGNAAAQRALAVALRHGLSVRLAFVPQGKDPCDFLRAAGAQAFGSLLNSATDALRFTWDRTEARYHSESGDAGRRAAILEFVDLVSGLCRFGALDAIQQGLIANQIAKLLGLRSDQVHRLFGEAAGRRRPASPGPVAVPAGQSPTAVGGSAEQAALTAILEVLLNESGLFDQVKDVFDPQRFEDPVLSRIGLAVRELAEQLGESTLVEVLDRFAEPADARCITELHLRGEQRGNFEATLTGAADCLRQLAAARQAVRSSSASQDSSEDGRGPTTEDSDTVPLEVIQNVSHGFGHFLSRSKLSAMRKPPA